MYENRFNRTRYGDPLITADQWQGLPAGIDAFAQVITTAGADYAIDTYFFKGSYCGSSLQLTYLQWYWRRRAGINGVTPLPSAVQL